MTEHASRALVLPAFIAAGLTGNSIISSVAFTGFIFTSTMETVHIVGDYLTELGPMANSLIKKSIIGAGLAATIWVWLNKDQINIIQQFI